MRQFFRDLRQFLLTSAGLVIALIILTIGEVVPRALARKSIPIALDQGVSADVKGQVQPDFLWIGHEWWITVTSNAPVSVEINGVWTANVPAGEHTICHSHDSNNTMDYATTSWSKVPTDVLVKKL